MAIPQLSPGYLETTRAIRSREDEAARDRDLQQKLALQHLAQNLALPLIQGLVSVGTDAAQYAIRAPERELKRETDNAKAMIRPSDPYYYDKKPTFTEGPREVETPTAPPSKADVAGVRNALANLPNTASAADVEQLRARLHPSPPSPQKEAQGGFGREPEAQRLGRRGPEQIDYKLSPLGEHFESLVAAQKFARERKLAKERLDAREVDIKAATEDRRLEEAKNNAAQKTAEITEKFNPSLMRGAWPAYRPGHRYPVPASWLQQASPKMFEAFASDQNKRFLRQGFDSPVWLNPTPEEDAALSEVLMATLSAWGKKGRTSVYVDNRTPAPEAIAQPAIRLRVSRLVNVETDSAKSPRYERRMVETEMSYDQFMRYAKNLPPVEQERLKKAWTAAEAAFNSGNSQDVERFNAQMQHMLGSNSFLPAVEAIQRQTVIDEGEDKGRLNPPPPPKPPREPLPPSPEALIKDSKAQRTTHLKAIADGLKRQKEAIQADGDMTPDAKAEAIRSLNTEIRKYKKAATASVSEYKAWLKGLNYTGKADTSFKPPEVVEPLPESAPVPGPTQPSAPQAPPSRRGPDSSGVTKKAMQMWEKIEALPETAAAKRRRWFAWLKQERGLA